ncbi:hypothetical protein CDL15_Pgr022049 [Punica granatum]|uniref:Uncharacterized protein n=1 Tax=Punica granatum TaxID=22663 RepID=A0A218VRY2_PUNGR|nr:hypothetical protein CDL15_Pgr022049 [Punica granatum]PKI70048.1 hypothetical protein CRG98_009511 [Punica granatum]
MGPRVWIRGFRVTLDGSGDRLGRIVSTGLDWAERVGPAQIEGKWAGSVRERTTGEDKDGLRGALQCCRWRFLLLGAMAMAREGEGDGSEHRLGYVVLEMGVTGIGTTEIEGNFEFSSEGFSTFNRRKSGGIEMRK